ncbi:FRG domain-containing protein, partial [Pantoea sp. SIMBA_079]
TEDDMVLAEANTLKLARREWRFDHLAALELMAHLQHLGGPTRLLDVSVNPLIATWFAVERNEADDRFDGRLFAFSVDRRIELAPEHNGRFPRWHT